MTPNLTPEPNEPPALAALREKVEQSSANEPPKKFLTQKKAHSGGMFGTAEIAALAASGAFLLLVLGFYFFWVVPAKAKNKELAAQRDKIEKDLTELKTKVTAGVSTQTTVDELIASSERFEINYLPPQAQGNTRIYERLNDLIRTNSLRKVSGPDYVPLDPNVKNQGGDDNKAAGRAKFQSLFPGLYITTTVEGTYANLRRMIQQIEQSGQFVIINTVELEPADSVEKQTVKVPTNNRSVPSNNPPVNPQIPNSANPNFNPTDPNGFNVPNNPTFQQPSTPSQPPTQTEIERTVKRRKGEIVSLKIEMATYFRREGVYSARTSENPNGN